MRSMESVRIWDADQWMGSVGFVSGIKTKLRSDGSQPMGSLTVGSVGLMRLVGVSGIANGTSHSGLSGDQWGSAVG